jgi:GH24 family phage-related lysozyme (muramidase)
MLEEGKFGNILKAATLATMVGSSAPGMPTHDYKTDTTVHQAANPTPTSKLNYNAIFKQLVKHEGYKKHIYLDKKNIPTIGIGFNLNDKGNQKILAKHGITQRHLQEGLTDAEIKALFDDTLKIATANAKRFAPNLDSLPANAQLAIVDLSFNLGPVKLAQFKVLQQALAKKDFKAAAAALKDSNWYYQVGNRGPDLVNQLLSASS